MFIKIIKAHPFYGQFLRVNDYSSKYYCANLGEEIFIEKHLCQPVKNVRERKKAFWKYRRFKNTYLKFLWIYNNFPSINVMFIPDKFFTPCIRLNMQYSICFFNDCEKWGIFSLEKNLPVRLGTFTDRELILWLQNI